MLVMRRMLQSKADTAVMRVKYGFGRTAVGTPKKINATMLLPIASKKEETLFIFVHTITNFVKQDYINVVEQ